MKLILWYKGKIIWNNPFKLVGLVFFPLLLFGMEVLFSVDLQSTYPLLGFCFTMIYTYLLFSVGDLLRIPCFVAMGVKVRTLWEANFIFITCIGTCMGVGMVAILSAIYTTDWKVLLDVSEQMLWLMPFSAFLVGLSTIHFANYNQIEIYFASFFALLNLVLYFVPLVFSYFRIAFTKQTSIICGIIGIMGLLGLEVYMRFASNEALMENIKKEVKSYDKAMLGLDED